MASFVLSITCLSFSSGFRTWFKVNIVSCMNYFGMVKLNLNVWCKFVILFQLCDDIWWPGLTECSYFQRIMILFRPLNMFNFEFRTSCLIGNWTSILFLCLWDAIQLAVVNQIKEDIIWRPHSCKLQIRNDIGLVTQPVLQYLNFLFINLLDVNFTFSVSETSFWDSYRVLDIVLFDILHQFFTLDEVLFWISVD
jgi:hypothetical protein